MRQLEHLTAYEVVEEKQLDEMKATGTVERGFLLCPVRMRIRCFP